MGLSDVATSSPFGLESVRAPSWDFAPAVLNKIFSFLEDVVAGKIDVDPSFLTNQSK